MIRISASGYSNTAPLVWSFLYGSARGSCEVIMDNAPARSAELLSQKRVDAALIPVIAYQTIDDLRLVPEVCVGAREKAKSVCLATKGKELSEVKTVSLDVSSKTSVALTKIIFREFLGVEPVFTDAKPNPAEMLSHSDAALIIGDPALSIPDEGFRTDDFEVRKFDLAEIWRAHTGLGFVFAMWTVRREKSPLDFAAARDEGLSRIEEIISNYEPQIPLSREEFRRYLIENISYSTDESMLKGLELYFNLALKHGLIERNKPLLFADKA